MTTPIDQTTIANLVRRLEILQTILTKGEADARARDIEPEIFLQSRLAPDMFPLVRQVQIATDIAKGCAARLAQREVPSYPDDETTFEGLQARLQKTIELCKSVTQAELEGSADRVVTLKMRVEEMQLSATTYLDAFVLPNLYFHASMVYAILRHNGVQLGKRDFLGDTENCAAA